MDKKLTVEFKKSSCSLFFLSSVMHVMLPMLLTHTYPGQDLLGELTQTFIQESEAMVN